MTTTQDATTYDPRACAYVGKLSELLTSLDVATLILMLALSFTLGWLLSNRLPAEGWKALAPIFVALPVFAFYFAREVAWDNLRTRGAWYDFVNREAMYETQAGTIITVQNLSDGVGITLAYQEKPGNYQRRYITIPEEVLRLFRSCRGVHKRIRPKVGQAVYVRFHKNLYTASELRFQPDRWTDAGLIQSCVPLGGGQWNLAIAFPGAGESISVQRFVMPLWLALDLLRRRQLSPTLLQSMRVQLKVPESSNDVVDLRVCET